MLRYQVYHWAWLALDWLFPPVCGGCGEPGARWCEGCRQRVQRIEPPICEHCGQEVSQGAVCARCQSAPPAATTVRSWAVFAGPLRQALHRVKYRRDLALAEALVADCEPFVRSLGWDVDIVAPVPMSRGRLKERGYNQAALLARPLALRLNIPYQPQLLRRVRDTRSQVGLNRAERRQNVARAFEAAASRASGRAVLLVDDVATSGATLDACAQALWRAGARSVFGFTLARAALDP